MKTLRNPVVHIANRATAQVDKPLCAAGVFIMENQIEIWKPVPGYECYEASSFGNVRRYKTNTKLKTSSKNILIGGHSKGYRMIAVCVNGKIKRIAVHQLVAMAFLNHKLCGLEKVVDHIDRNRLNNRLDNLRIISTRENITNVKRPDNKYAGVHKVKRNKNPTWGAGLLFKGKRVHLGHFDCPIKASNAYQEAVQKINNNNFKPRV